MTATEQALFNIIMPMENGFCCQEHAAAVAKKVAAYIREHYIAAPQNASEREGRTAEHGNGDRSRRDTQLLIALGQYLMRRHAREYRDGRNYEVDGEEIELLISLSLNTRPPEVAADVRLSLDKRTQPNASLTGA